MLSKTVILSSPELWWIITKTNLIFWSTPMWDVNKRKQVLFEPDSDLHLHLFHQYIQKHGGKKKASKNKRKTSSYFIIDQLSVCNLALLVGNKKHHNFLLSVVPVNIIFGCLSWMSYSALVLCREFVPSRGAYKPVLCEFCRHVISI